MVVEFETGLKGAENGGWDVAIPVFTEEAVELR